MQLCIATGQVNAASVVLPPRQRERRAPRARDEGDDKNNYGNQRQNNGKPQPHEQICKFYDQVKLKNLCSHGDNCGFLHIQPNETLLPTKGSQKNEKINGKLVLPEGIDYAHASGKVVANAPAKPVTPSLAAGDGTEAEPAKDTKAEELAADKKPEEEKPVKKPAEPKAKGGNKQATPETAKETPAAKPEAAPQQAKPTKPVAEPTKPAAESDKQTKTTYTFEVKRPVGPFQGQQTFIEIDGVLYLQITHPEQNLEQEPDWLTSVKQSVAEIKDPSKKPVFEAAAFSNLVVSNTPPKKNKKNKNAPQQGGLAPSFAQLQMQQRVVKK